MMTGSRHLHQDRTMNKESSSFTKFSLMNDMDTQPIIDWLTLNKKTILIAFAILFTLLILSHRILSQRAINTESDYIRAQTLFQEIQAPSTTEGSDQKQLKELQAILQRRPEFGVIYNGTLAELLLIQGKAAEAASFASPLFERTEKNHLPLYQSFGKTALLIAAGKYQQAYESAKTLKLEMEQADPHTYGPLLYAYNLLRLAALEQQLGYQKEEQQSWESLTAYIAKESSLADFNLIFSAGTASLAGYSEHRRAAL